MLVRLTQHGERHSTIVEIVEDPIHPGVFTLHGQDAQGKRLLPVHYTLNALVEVIWQEAKQS